MPRGQIFSALFVVLAAFGGLIYTVASGNEPLLGLDLQGGVSVVLEPIEEATDDQLNESVNVVRGRVDQVGVASPEISRQGNNIVVELPGLVKDQQETIDKLDQTAELRYRPVLGVLPQLLVDTALPVPGETPPVSGSDTTVDGTATTENEEVTTTASETSVEQDEPQITENSREAAVVPVAFQTETTIEPQDVAESVTPSATATGEETSETPETTLLDPSLIDPSTQPDLSELLGGQAPLDPNCPQEITAPEKDSAEEYVVLLDEDGMPTCLGPTLLFGDALETAGVSSAINTSPFSGELETIWFVNPEFKEGAEGIDLFNSAAALCFTRAPQCPTSRLAMVLDHRIISAPNTNSASFARNAIQISGNFTEESARDLAQSLRFGALPVELEKQESRTVSATVGKDVLRAGLIAGLVGLGIVALYLLYYYRFAGIVAISGIVLSAMLLWTIIAFLGEQINLSLTLAGVVGLIVSIGVSADSNIVYFENVKDAFRTGRKVGTSVERAYQSSIGTILKADVVSLIAAVLLYYLTVGAVKNFAFYLGLATLLDLFISWFFMRPALRSLASLPLVKKSPKWLGMPRRSES